MGFQLFWVYLWQCKVELLLLCANCDEFVFENVLRIRPWYNGNPVESKPMIPLDKNVKSSDPKKTSRASYCSLSSTSCSELLS